MTSRSFVSRNTGATGGDLDGFKRVILPLPFAAATLSLIAIISNMQSGSECASRPSVIPLQVSAFIVYVKLIKALCLKSVLVDEQSLNFSPRISSSVVSRKCSAGAAMTFAEVK
jgi:hypothetical protein